MAKELNAIIGQFNKYSTYIITCNSSLVFTSHDTIAFIISEQTSGLILVELIFQTYFTPPILQSLAFLIWTDIVFIGPTITL